MAATVRRRGPDDRRSSVLAPSETGRIRSEASLPAHRAGSRIPVGGAGLRLRLAYVTAATTAIAALAFLIPLGWELRTDRRDQALSTAAAQGATVAGALAAGAQKKDLQRAIVAAGGMPVVHPPGDTKNSRVTAQDLIGRIRAGVPPGLATDPWNVNEADVYGCRATARRAMNERWRSSSTSPHRTS